VKITGLSDTDARQRLSKYGLNTIGPDKKISLPQRILLQLKSPVTLVLLTATIVSGVVGDLLDSIAILIIIILNLGIALTQELKADATVAALKTLATPLARVLRSGKKKEIPAAHVVPGDYLILDAGDYIAADAQLIEAFQLSVDESILTGESLPLEKQSDDMIFGATLVTTGSGMAKVTATGMTSEVGKIAQLLTESNPDKTPLQLRMDESSRLLLYISGGIVIAVSILFLVQGQPWQHIGLLAISLAVAAIPEGLPTITTLALTLAVGRLSKRNAIVRNLMAVETLGSTEIICTDKTGTLTTGKMEVREIKSANIESLLTSFVYCNNSFLNETGAGSGDPTEVALLQYAHTQRPQFEEIPGHTDRIAEWSFDSDRKRMSVAVREKDGIHIYSKGAPESILPICLLSNTESQSILDDVQKLSQNGLRVLAFASKSVKESYPAGHWTTDTPTDEIEHSLTFLGLAGLADPPRPESYEAVSACQAAGVRVVMITGDHPITAKAIASELGILGPHSIISGDDLDKMTPEELLNRVESVSVFARVKPKHKLAIVSAWKKRGRVVAMTGDGVNDAPALKAASIGVSMGKGGTEVARQSSDLILMDDNFSTIVSAIKEGRMVFGNIQRTIQYLLSGNLAEVLVVAGAALIGLPSPLAPIHLLWINLVTDGLPSLGLAAEPMHKNILRESPNPSPATFFNTQFYLEMLGSGVAIATLGLGIYVFGGMFFEIDKAPTYVFSFIVFEELFRSFAFRSNDQTYFQCGMRTNKVHLVAVGVSLIVQWVILGIPLFQRLFKVVPLTLIEYTVIVIIALIPVSALEIGKLIRLSRRRTPADIG
jgi:Ca2+-transporting ATPase